MHRIKLGVMKLAYKILYSPENNKQYPQYRSRNKPRLTILLVVILLLFGCVWIKFIGFPDFLIPGDKEITVEATKQMIESLRFGTPIDIAVTTFCKDIIHGAGF